MLVKAQSNMEPNSDGIERAAATEGQQCCQPVSVCLASRWHAGTPLLNSVGNRVGCSFCLLITNPGIVLHLVAVGPVVGLQSQGVEPQGVETSEVVVFASNDLDKYECMIGRLSVTLKDPTDFYCCSCGFVVRQ